VLCGHDPEPWLVDELLAASSPRLQKMGLADLMVLTEGRAGAAAVTAAGAAAAAAAWCNKIPPGGRGGGGGTGALVCVRWRGETG